MFEKGIRVGGEVKERRVIAICIENPCEFWVGVQFHRLDRQNGEPAAFESTELPAVTFWPSNSLAENVLSERVSRECLAIADKYVPLRRTVRAVLSAPTRAGNGARLHDEAMKRRWLIDGGRYGLHQVQMRDFDAILQCNNNRPFYLRTGGGEWRFKFSDFHDDCNGILEDFKQLPILTLGQLVIMLISRRKKVVMEGRLTQFAPLQIRVFILWIQGLIERVASGRSPSHLIRSLMCVYAGTECQTCLVQKIFSLGLSGQSTMPYPLSVISEGEVEAIRFNREDVQIRFLPHAPVAAREISNFQETVFPGLEHAQIRLVGMNLKFVLGSGPFAHQIQLNTARFSSTQARASEELERFIWTQVLCCPISM
jgi:hypothetical protein